MMRSDLSLAEKVDIDLIASNSSSEREMPHTSARYSSMVHHPPWAPDRSSLWNRAAAGGILIRVRDKDAPAMGDAPAPREKPATWGGLL
jgi:hypothetical protein